MPASRGAATRPASWPRSRSRATRDRSGSPSTRFRAQHGGALDPKTNGNPMTPLLPVSVEKQAERSSPRPLRPRRRLAERPLLSARQLARRAHLVRAVHRQAARLRLAVARRRRSLHQHVAGVQLPRRERRRLGRLLVRLERDPLRRPRASVPRLRRPLPLPRLGPQLHLVAEHDREAGRVPVRRRPRVVQERGRARTRVRPRRLSPATPSTRRSVPTTSSSATATWAGT